MRTLGALFVISLGLCGGGAAALAQQQEPAKLLVREVVYNELHDHEDHGSWLYWVKQRTADDTKLSQQVETRDGIAARVLMVNGRPLDEESRRTELAKLDALISSPAQLQNRRQAYVEDEKRIGRVLAMLPDAFLFEDVGQEKDCRHLRFRPDPAYSARTVEARIFHAISGDLWLDTRMKRLIKLQGQMDTDLNFGLGLLGKVNKGSWFRVERTQVSPAEWKMNALEVHLSGRAILFKTLAHETSEMRGGFKPLPDGTTLSQGARLLTESNAMSAEAVAAQFAPVVFRKRR